MQTYYTKHYRYWNLISIEKKKKGRLVFVLEFVKKNYYREKKERIILCPAITEKNFDSRKSIDIRYVQTFLWYELSYSRFFFSSTRVLSLCRLSFFCLMKRKKWIFIQFFQIVGNAHGNINARLILCNSLTIIIIPRGIEWKGCTFH